MSRIWMVILGLLGALWLSGCTRSKPTPLPEDKYYLGGEAKAPSGVANTPLPRVNLQSVPTVRAAALSPDPSRVAVKFLVIATDKDDLLLPAWEERLKEVGAAYDIFFSGARQLTYDVLLNPEGTGKYNAILLTTSGLLVPDASDPTKFVGSLDGGEWNFLWQYEREYGVRQVALFASPGVYPEDYCLRSNKELGQKVGDPVFPIGLTSKGQEVFSYLKADVKVPILNSFSYLSKLQPKEGDPQTACKATTQPIFSDAEGNVLGVLSTSEDGRERLALTFNQNANLLQSQLLGYGLLRWASKGLFFGERRMFFNVDVDDWFIPTAWRKASGIPDPCGYRMNLVDATSVPTQQKNLRQRFPLASSFTLNLAFVGRGVNVDNLKVNGCFPDLKNPDPLVEYTKQIKNEFRWINHTYQHIFPLDLKTQAYVEDDIQQNQQTASDEKIGLKLDALPNMLKTPELSGLGYYNAEGTLFGNKTDYGLEASNREFLAGAKARGITVLHANMSVKSQRPICFNCGIYHPLETSIFLIPVWPNSVAFSSTTPEEATIYYNSVYGPGGITPVWPKALNYEEFLEADADVALRHLVTGSINPHYMHQGNLREYSVEKSVVFDWINQVIEQYTRYFQLPLRNVSWRTIINYTTTRNTHFNTLWAGMYGVVNRTTNEVTIVSPQTSQVFITGLAPSVSSDLRGQQVYGGDVISRIQVDASRPVVLKLGNGLSPASLASKGSEADW